MLIHSSVAHRKTVQLTGVSICDGMSSRITQMLATSWTGICGCVDGTVVRASRAAAGCGAKRGPAEPSDHALGRSRGGFSGKLHFVTDGRGLPLAVHVTGGQWQESPQFESVMNAVRVARSVIEARPNRHGGGHSAERARVVHCQTPSLGGGFDQRPKRSVRCRRAHLVNRSARGFTFAHTSCVLLEVIMDVRLVIEPHASEALKEVVREGLALHNVAATGAAEYYPVCLFLKNEHQEVLGGLLGQTPPRPPGSCALLVIAARKAWCTG
jgi:hypothetical protein